MAINARRGQAFRYRGRQEKVIDAQTGVTTECVPEIVPERIGPLIRMQRPQGVRPSLGYEIAVGFPHLGSKKGVIDPAFGLIDVQLCRHDIVIAGQNHR